MNRLNMHYKFLILVLFGINLFTTLPAPGTTSDSVFCWQTFYIKNITTLHTNYKEQVIKYSDNDFKRLKLTFNYFWQRQTVYNKNLSILQTNQEEQVIKKPENAFEKLKLAYIYFWQQNYEKSINIIYHLQSHSDKKLSCQYHYLKAKILFEMKQDSLAILCYTKAMQQISSEQNAHLFYHDLCYIMKDIEYSELQSLLLNDLNQFYQRFWLSRDPLLSTQLNERIGEHYRRLNYARQNFRRYKKDESKRKAYYFSITNSKFGDAFIKAYQTEALPENRELDDMGLIYVRHGKPDNWMTYLCASCNLNLSWHYFESTQNPEMIFHFIKTASLRGWIMTALPVYFNNRHELGIKYAQIDPEVNTSISEHDLLETLSIKNELAIHNEKHVEEGLKKETFKVLMDEEPIQIPLQIFTFKAKNNLCKLDFYYGIEGQQVQSKATDHGSNLDLHTFWAIHDPHWNEVIRKHEDNKIPLRGICEKEWTQNSIIIKKQIEVPPGDCHIEFHLRDNISTKIGRYKGTIQIPDYYQNRLMLSDIVLTQPTDTNSSGNLKAKYMAHLFQPFSKNAIIGLYFEVYNLIFNESGWTKYRISYTIQPSETHRNLFTSLLKKREEKITLDHDYLSEHRDDKVIYNLDTQNLTAGEYNLIINVKDLISEETTTKKIQFNIYSL